MAAIISRANAVDYVKTEAILLRYAGQSEDAITDALAAANGEGLAALRRSGRYTTTAIDALTAGTSPGDLRSFVLARFLHHLTKSGEHRPDAITTAAEDAAKTLSLIATGNYIVDGITAVSSAATSSSMPDLSFDNTDTDSGFYNRDRDL